MSLRRDWITFGGAAARTARSARRGESRHVLGALQKTLRYERFELCLFESSLESRVEQYAALGREYCRARGASAPKFLEAIVKSLILTIGAPKIIAVPPIYSVAPNLHAYSRLMIRPDWKKTAANFSVMLETRAVTRNFLLGGGRPGTGGHSLLNIDFQNFLENLYKIRTKVYNF